MSDGEIRNSVLDMLSMKRLLDTQVERPVSRWIYEYGVQGRGPGWKQRFVTTDHIAL